MTDMNGLLSGVKHMDLNSPSRRRARRHRDRRSQNSTSSVDTPGNNSMLDNNGNTPDNVNNPITVSAYGSATLEGMQGHANEDRLVIHSTDDFHLFAALDGHGGSGAANYLQEKISTAVMTSQSKGDIDSSALAKALVELDRVFCRNSVRNGFNDTSGVCIAGIILYMDSDRQPQILAFNVGDCRVVVHTSKPAKNSKRMSLAAGTTALTVDHCASNSKEKERLERAGGYIEDDRVAGVMEPFRSIGDVDMKEDSMQGWVIPNPEFKEVELDMSKQNVFVIATDGVWGVLENNEAMQVALRKVEEGNYTGDCAHNAAQAVVNAASENGSIDDISAVVVVL